MHDLLEWLRVQNSGLATYEAFQRKVLALREEQPEHSALARLLADLAGRFTDAYDCEPLPVDVTVRARRRLIDLLQKAVQSQGAAPAERVAVLNEIGNVDFL